MNTNPLLIVTAGVITGLLAEIVAGQEPNIDWKSYQARVQQLERRLNELRPTGDQQRRQRSTAWETNLETRTAGLTQELKELREKQVQKVEDAIRAPVAPARNRDSAKHAVIAPQGKAKSEWAVLALHENGEGMVLARPVSFTQVKFTKAHGLTQVAGEIVSFMGHGSYVHGIIPTRRYEIKRWCHSEREADVAIQAFERNARKDGFGPEPPLLVVPKKN